MAALVAVVLALATTSLTLATAMKNGVFPGYGWAVPYLIALSVALYVLAAILAVIHFRRERKKDATITPARLLPVQNQTVTQSFSPQFNPQQNLYIGLSEAANPVEQEEARLEKLILDYMQKENPKTRPSMAFEVDEVATALKISMPASWNTLERMKAKHILWSVSLNEAVQGVAYFLEDVYRI